MTVSTSETEIKSADSADTKGGWRETIKTLILAVVLALTFRTCAYEPFHIPSGSMKSNLLVGDYLFVSKFSYGYSRYSLPWYLKLIPFNERIFEATPKRGDIIVFHPPQSPTLSDPYIKRLLGMPGDRVQVKNAVLYINDKPLPKEYVDDWYDAENGTKLSRFKETLPEGRSILTLHEKNRVIPPGFDAENTEEYVVPEGHYFMMGDNRDHSRDSRFPDPVGFVPAENLVGRADIILFSWGGDTFFRMGRFFKTLP
jgi:signal peptidase I